MPSIAVVDDSGVTRTVLAKLAQRLSDGCPVAAFDNPIAALEGIRDLSPDLVITDFRMPEMDADMMIRHIREDGDGSILPIMVVTAHGDREYVYRALKAGATDILNHPIDHKEFLARASNLLELRRLQRKELAEQSKIMDSAFDHMAQGICVIDAELRVKAFNKQFTRLMAGLGSAMRIGGDVRHAIRHNATVGAFCEANAHELAEWQIARMEAGEPYRLTRLSGDGRTFDIDLKPTPAGGMVVTISDVTDLLRSKTELAAKSVLLEGTFDNMAEGLVALDADLKVLASNPQSSRLLEMPESMFDAGSDFVRVLVRLAEIAVDGTHDAQRDIDIFREVVRDSVRHELVHKIGRGRTISMRVNPQPSSGCVVTLADLTTRVAAEERLRHGQKLEALGQLAGGVSHEFNNLLTSIIGFTRMALRNSDDERRVMDCLTEVAEVSERAAELTRQMLTFSHKQVLPPSVVRIGEVVGGMDKLLRAFVEESIELKVDIADDTACAEVDTARLTQCIVNLVSNGRDAMPKGGCMTIRCDATTLDSPVVTSHGADLPAGRYVRIGVADQGKGIDADTLARIFDPFFTTKEKGKGTGLGLSLVYGMIKNFGGVIDVETQMGVGTTFTIFLPIVDKEPSAQTARGAKVEDDVLAPVGGGRIVLVAEDDLHVRQFAKTSLEDAGFRVLTAEDGEEAQLVFDQYAAEIDLLVTDIVMPKVGGVELAKTLTDRQPDLKVIYMSGYAPELDGRLDKLAEGSRFLKKPFDPDALGRMARDALVS